MTASTPAPEPSPILIFRTLNAYQQTAALKAAIELDLFTAVAEGAHTSPALARRCAASERGVRILSDYLVVLGLLTKAGDRYGLTPDAATFLDRRSPAYVGTAVTFLSAPVLTESFTALPAAVRQGGTMLPKDGSLAPEHPIWVEFARAMAPMMRQPAAVLAELLQADAPTPWKVLDIAAGHGLFGITLAQRNPNAEIVAVDWPNVLEVATGNAQAAGVASRYRTIPGSAFAVEYGTGYDLALLTNFLHHFDPPACVQLLRKVHAALTPEGRAVILELVPNDDRVTPPMAAMFALTMLATTPHGEAYPFSEYRRMLKDAGFSDSELHEVPPADGRAIIIAYKRGR